jgi:hypothetical protein
MFNLQFLKHPEKFAARVGIVTLALLLCDQGALATQMFFALPNMVLGFHKVPLEHRNVQSGDSPHVAAAEVGRGNRRRPLSGIAGYLRLTGIKSAFAAEVDESQSVWPRRMVRTTRLLRRKREIAMEIASRLTLGARHLARGDVVHLNDDIEGGSILLADPTYEKGAERD